MPSLLTLLIRLSLMRTVSKLFFLFGLLCFSAAKAQKNGSLFSGARESETFVKLNVAGVADPVSPSLQAGAEHRFTDRWAVELLAGIPFYPFHAKKNKDSFYHTNFKIKPQVKFYFGLSSSYAALEVFGTFLKFNRFNGQYSVDTTTFSYAEAGYKKCITGIALKWGKTRLLSEKWFFETSTVLGVRWVNTSVKAMNARPSVPRFQEWINTVERIGRKVTPHAALELKFAYRLL